MNIIFTTSALEKKFGGPPNAVVGAAAALASKGHDVTLIIFGQTSLSEIDNQDLFNILRINNVKIIRMRSSKTRIRGAFFGLRTLIQVSRVLESANFVSMHGVYYYHNPLIALLCKRLRIPFSLMPHGAMTTYQRKQSKIKKMLVGFFFEKYVPLKASAVFTATAEEAEQLPARLKAKSVVVGLGIFSEAFPQRVSSEQQKEFNFLYMGRITKKKRLDLLITSIAILKLKTTIPFKLIVCGSGDAQMESSLEKYALELDVQEYIEYRGWVSGEEKSKIMINSQCFVLPSEDENFGIAIPECLDHGLPCILSSKVATSKVVSDFNAGIVIDALEPNLLAEAMLRMINTESLETLRSSALQASKEFRWESVILNWESCINHLIASNNP